MNSVPPHQLLSAYLDGELSACEREEVERLLERSPEARQELAELEHVGTLLRQLPREALPKSFAPQVLDACLSDTGVFETPTQLPATASPNISQEPNFSRQRRFRPRNKSWLGLTGLSLAASVLGLIVYFSLPKPTESENVAQKSPPTAGAETLGLPFKAAEDALEMQLADDGNAGRAKNDAYFQTGQAESATTPGEEAQAQSAAIASTDALLAPGAMDRKTPALSDKELKDLPVGQIVEAMDHQGDQVAVVKLVVEDRAQGLVQLKRLLQKHNIAHEPSAESEREKPEADASKAADEAELLAVYVETSEDRLGFVLQDLQKEAAFHQLTMEAPVVAAQSDLYVQSPNAKPNAGARSRQMQFGGLGDNVPGPKAFRGPQAMKAEAAAPKPGPKPAPAKKTPDKAEAKTDRPESPTPSDPGKTGVAPADEPAALSKPSVAGFGAGGSPDLREVEKAVPKRDPSPNEAKSTARDKESVRPMAEPAEAPSVQRELQLSPGDLESLQEQLAEQDAKAAADARRKLGGAEKPASPKLVQVLFVLVGKAEKSEASPAANAPSSND